MQGRVIVIREAEPDAIAWTVYADFSAVRRADAPLAEGVEPSAFLAYSAALIFLTTGQPPPKRPLPQVA